ncbi:MAG: hypothetical protein ACLFS4_00810 [Opitutales bacterium]
MAVEEGIFLSMDPILEVIFSRDIIAVGIIIIIAVLVLKFLKNASKGLVLFLLIVALLYILYRYFPGMVQPLVDYVQGNWMDV